MTEEQSLAPNDNFNIVQLLIAAALLLALPLMHVFIGLSVYLF